MRRRMSQIYKTGDAGYSMLDLELNRFAVCAFPVHVICERGGIIV